MNQRFVVIAAILAFLVLAEEASDMKFGPNRPVPDQNRAVDAAKPVEPNASLDKIPVAKRANSLGLDENSPEPRPPLTCLQLQVVDEIDLLGDTKCE